MFDNEIEIFRGAKYCSMLKNREVFILLKSHAIFFTFEISKIKSSQKFLSSNPCNISTTARSRERPYTALPTPKQARPRPTDLPAQSILVEVLSKAEENLSKLTAAVWYLQLTVEHSLPQDLLSWS